METTTDYIFNCPVPIGLAIITLTLILLKCVLLRGGDLCGCFSCLLGDLLIGGVFLSFTTTKKPFFRSDTTSCPADRQPPPPISKSRAADQICAAERPPPLISKLRDVDQPVIGAVDQICAAERPPPRNSKSGDVDRQAIGAIDRRTDVKVTRGEIEMVMERLGLTNGGDEVVSEAEVGWEEIGSVFGEEEPSVGEVKEAFDVFDRNGDGYIDAAELRRVLCAIGVEGVSEGECRRRLRSLAGEKNVDGRIDFKEFIKIVDKSFACL